VRFVIFGGGCYGSFYVRQLLRARRAGALAVDDILVVDHGDRPPAADLAGADVPLRHIRADWSDFLDGYLASAVPPTDQIVPPPFTPNLAVGWLIRSLQQEFPAARFVTEDFRALPGTPFQDQRAHGTLAVSHADWLCPVNCIEPARCPATRGPRHWDMDRTMRAFAEHLRTVGQPVRRICLFHCHHLAYGVGTYPAAALAEARGLLRADLAADGAVRFLAGTISRCHGAVHVIHAGSGTDSVSATPNLRHDSANLSGAVLNNE